MELLSLIQRCKKMVKAARTETGKRKRYQNITEKIKIVLRRYKFEPFCIHSFETGQTWIDHFNGKKNQAK
jgi:hypothetical protein